MGLMGWAHKHSGFDESKLWLTNDGHVTKTNIYWILSMGLMGWAHRHNCFDKCKLELPNVGRVTSKNIYKNVQWSSWAGHTTTIYIYLMSLFWKHPIQDMLKLRV